MITNDKLIKTKLGLWKDGKQLTTAQIASASEHNTLL
jgi:hypothetical protein